METKNCSITWRHSFVSDCDKILWGQYTQTISCVPGIDFDVMLLSPW